jgi:hypothetical protein
MHVLLDVKGDTLLNGSSRFKGLVPKIFMDWRFGKLRLRSTVCSLKSMKLSSSDSSEIPSKREWLPQHQEWNPLLKSEQERERNHLLKSRNRFAMECMHLSSRTLVLWPSLLTLSEILKSFCNHFAIRGAISCFLPYQFKSKRLSHTRLRLHL